MQTETYPRNPVLFVDDEPALLHSFGNILRKVGINNVLCCSDSREVEAILSSQDLEVVVLDLYMPKVSGQEVLSMLTARVPDVPVLIVTGADAVETAVSCMKQGASDYMVKPVDHHRLITAVTRAIELRELKRENAHLRRHVLIGKLEHPEAFATTITNDEGMLSLFKYVEAVAPSNEPVFITGETGVGKELIARSLHTLSGRSGEFVPVNAAGLDDMIFADTFFGHVRGAYTGADSARAGLVEKASGGTLLLDEICDLTIVSQVKLLRLLQEGEYFPLGSDTPKRSDARVIVATNRNVHHLLETGRFRKDLYFRLLSHHIHLPPLRQRQRDLPILVDHFIEEAARILGKPRPTYPKELFTYLSTYHFPGNIRELKSLIHDAVSSHQSGVLGLGTFIEYIDKQHASRKDETGGSLLGWTTAPGLSTELPTLEQATLLLVEDALRRTGGNQTAAAHLLGISRQTINKYCTALRSGRQKPPVGEEASGCLES